VEASEGFIYLVSDLLIVIQYAAHFLVYFSVDSQPPFPLPFANCFLNYFIHANNTNSFFFFWNLQVADMKTEIILLL
jgi:hypothetical protein